MGWKEKGCLLRAGGGGGWWSLGGDRRIARAFPKSPQAFKVLSGDIRGQLFSAPTHWSGTSLPKKLPLAYLAGFPVRCGQGMTHSALYCLGWMDLSFKTSIALVAGDFLWKSLGGRKDVIALKPPKTHILPVSDWWCYRIICRELSYDMVASASKKADLQRLGMLSWVWEIFPYSLHIKALKEIQPSVST